MSVGSKFERATIQYKSPQVVGKHEKPEIDIGQDDRTTDGRNRIGQPRLKDVIPDLISLQ